MGHNVPLAGLGDGDDGVGTSAIEGHGRVQIPVVERLLVFPKQLEDHVVDGQHGGHIVQWGQQVLRGVEQFGPRQQPVEVQPRQLPQPDCHAPRFVARTDRAARHVLQTSRRLAALDPVVEQPKAPRLVAHQRLRQAAGIAPDPRFGMHRRRDVNIDRHPPLSGKRADCTTFQTKEQSALTRILPRSGE